VTSVNIAVTVANPLAEGGGFRIEFGEGYGFLNASLAGGVGHVNLTGRGVLLISGLGKVAGGGLLSLSLHGVGA
jgi:hypothetical protein